MHGDAAEEAEALISEVKKKIPQGIIAVRGQISPALGVLPARDWLESVF